MTRPPYHHHLLLLPPCCQEEAGLAHCLALHPMIKRGREWWG